MMTDREILFRGRWIDNGEWVTGFYFRRLDTLGGIIESIIIEDAYTQVSYGQTYLRSDIGKECYRVDPATVGQYTGLKDKNGQRIFEGDVVDQHAQGDILVCRGVINFDERNARFAHQLRTMNQGLCLFNSEAWEVVGNIHDNPELVKEEAK